MAAPQSCAICGGRAFEDRKVLWPELIQAWELTPDEVTLIDRQQGRTCLQCGSNWRTIALASALMAEFEFDGLFADFIAESARRGLRILEINGAGNLSTWLQQSPLWQRVDYPAVDMQRLPMAASTYDLVIHSDTLEHVPDPLRGLSECRRVLKPGGRCVFTVPIVAGRMSRSCAGRPPSYHGRPENPDDYRVHTEFGADVWIWPLQAGFVSCHLHAWDYPSAMAICSRTSHQSTAEIEEPATDRNLSEQAAINDVAATWGATAQSSADLPAGTEPPITEERLWPTMTGAIVREHLHRYELAYRMATGQRVLDLASGEGYGSALLAQVAHSVIGVDLDPRVVEHARRKYPRENLQFLTGSGLQIPLPDQSIDLAVSFETLEHVADPEQFVGELKRVLTPAGTLIISTPNVEVYRRGMAHNPYHVRELSLDEFRQVLSRHFQNVWLAGQQMWAGSAIVPLDTGPEVVDFAQTVGDFEHFQAKSLRSTAVYFLAVASAGATPPPHPWGLFACPGDPPHFDELLTELSQTRSQFESVLNSRSWKITQPLRWVTEHLGK